MVQRVITLALLAASIQRAGSESHADADAMKSLASLLAVSKTDQAFQGRGLGAASSRRDLASKVAAATALFAASPVFAIQKPLSAVFTVEGSNVEELGVQNFRVVRGNKKRPFAEPMVRSDMLKADPKGPYNGRMTMALGPRTADPDGTKSWGKGGKPTKCKGRYAKNKCITFLKDLGDAGPSPSVDAPPVVKALYAKSQQRRKDRGGRLKMGQLQPNSRWGQTIYPAKKPVGQKIVEGTIKI